MNPLGVVRADADEVRDRGVDKQPVVGRADAARDELRDHGVVQPVAGRADRDADIAAVLDPIAQAVTTGRADLVAPSARAVPAPDELDTALAIAARGRGLTFIAMPAPLVAPSAIVDAWPDAPLVAWSSPTDGIALVGVGIAAELRGHGATRWSQVATAARATRIAGAIVLGASSRADALGTDATRPRTAGLGTEANRSRTALETKGLDTEAARSRTALETKGLDTDAARSRTALETKGLDTDAARSRNGALDVNVAEPRLSRTGVLGFARPRFLGGAAFAPGAASASPWTGFGDAWFVLPRWTYVHDTAAAWLVLAVDANAAREATRWHREHATFRRAFTRDAAAPTRLATEDGSAPTWARPATDSHARFDTSDDASDLYRVQVEAITSAIANGDCSKVVAARSCAIALDAATAATALATLDARHPECFRVVMRPPGGGSLVAATPERLVRLDADGIHCDALAGTVRLDSNDAEARLLASDKDRREHAIVVDAIREALESVGAKVDELDVPAIKRLRHVLHLHTPIHASVPRDSRPLHLLELAARLHPTPAVGGTPTAFAVDWIRDHEPMPRGWYASPVGWFDLDGNGELAVAIRSGVLVGNHAHLWAGAGIVAGSDPDRELAETELKLRAMLGALRGGTGGGR